MDDHFRRRNQNDHSMRPPSDPRYHQPPQDGSQRHYQQGAPPGVDRQRMSSGAGYGAYYQEQADGAFATGAGLSHNAMGYSQPTADYANDARQSFAGAYPPLYGVQQPGPPNPVFDATTSFGSRQHSSMQMMPAGVTPGPYYPGDSAGAAAAVALHGGPSSSVYQHPTASDSRSSLVSGGYGTPMAPPLTSTSSSGLGSQQQQQQPAGPNLGAPSAPLAPAVSRSQDVGETNEEFASYQRNLKEVFQNIRDGALAPAGDTLLDISEWLLTSVERLELTIDNEDLYDGRLKMWRNFNHAWLALMGKQKEMMWDGKRPAHPQSLVPFASLQHMARELVRLCDSVERFGLVDYDYGVWEERIMTVLTECVQLYGMGEDESVSATTSSHQG